MKRTRWTEHTRARFLEALRLTANVSEAAHAAGVGRARAYGIRSEDPAFAAAWDEAEAVAVDKLEREAWRRAIEGWDEPVFYKGEAQGVVRKYSDRMLELLLKANRPEKFVERREVTSTITGAFTLELGRDDEDST